MYGVIVPMIKNNTLWRYGKGSTQSKICDLDHKMEGIEQIRLRGKRSLLYIDKKIQLKS